MSSFCDVDTPLKHDSSTMVIKEAEVDLKMQPVVKWLNSFSSVYTVYSCQGHDVAVSPPYVIFYCSESIELLNILHYSRDYVDVEVEYWRGSLRYVMRFKTVVGHFGEINGMVLNSLEAFLVKRGEIK